MPPELIVLAVTCLIAGASLLLPWGLRGQLVLVATALASSALLLAAAPASAVPASYLFFVAAAAGAISLFGAYHLDLHRFAIFCEATRREEEAAIGQSLVAIAREINDSLEAVDALDRIADAIRSALYASWSVIILRDAQPPGPYSRGPPGPRGWCPSSARWRAIASPAPAGASIRWRRSVRPAVGTPRR